MNKPPEHFKVGDVVIHQGNNEGERRGEEYTITSGLFILGRLHSRGGIEKDVYVFWLNGIGYKGLPLAAKPEWLKKKQDPGELSYTDLIASLNTPVEVPQ